MLKNILWVFTLFLFCNCNKKGIYDGDLPDGYIALSFDDRSVNNWYDHLGLLDSLGMKATFYVCRYYELNSREKEKLRMIQSHGNEIGFHTRTHPDLVKMVESKGLECVLKKEIIQGLEEFKRDGFNPVNFAYPYGRRNSDLDRALLSIFKSVRSTTPKQNHNTCMAPYKASGQVFSGLPVDMRSWANEGMIEAMIQKAAEKHNCVFLYAHEIDNPAYSFNVSRERLIFIQKMAKKYNVAFVTTNEMVQ